MYSDTHFHLGYIIERSSADEAAKVLEAMAESNVYFGMDIGTKSTDLLARYCAIQECISMLNEAARKRVKGFLHFSAGIWPDPNAIRQRKESIEELKGEIKKFKELGQKVTAIGEGGLDHHWNPSGPDGRKEEDFDSELFKGEKELFLMQLELAKEEDLPFIVHSRDAFEDTLACIKEAGYNRGIIHCFSYGLEEAKAFLDLGWYLALGGGTTYTKKRDMEKMTDLLRYIPSDRLLLETDAPYLAPVPLRGTMNTPANIRYVYDFIANARGIPTADLCNIVDSNIRQLFKI